MEIMERVNKVFRILFNNDNLEVTKDTCAEDIEEWDSLQHINLLTMLEKEFGIEFGVEDVIAMEDVGDMIVVIEAKLV